MQFKAESEKDSEMYCRTLMNIFYFPTKKLAEFGIFNGITVVLA